MRVGMPRKQALSSKITESTEAPTLSICFLPKRFTEQRRACTSTAASSGHCLGVDAYPRLQLFSMKGGRGLTNSLASQSAATT